MTFAAACGSGGVSEDGLIFNPDEIYTLDEFTAAGYAKPDRIELAGIPNANAQEAWFGFFNQKNVQVLLYESHDDAIDHGVKFAEEVVAAEPRSGAVGGFHLFAAYAVSGNAVLLCESSSDPCEELIGQLTAS